MLSGQKKVLCDICFLVDAISICVASISILVWGRFHYVASIFNFRFEWFRFRVLSVSGLDRYDCFLIYQFVVFDLLLSFQYYVLVCSMFIFKRYSLRL